MGGSVVQKQAARTCGVKLGGGWQLEGTFISAARRWSAQLDPEAGDHRPPAPDIAFDEAAEGLGRAAHGREARVVQHLAHGGVFQQLGHVRGHALGIGFNGPLAYAPFLYAKTPYEPAKDLGVAFQLANFIRDVNEDLDRGRVYLPLEELDRFGVSRADLEKRVLTEDIVAALKFQIQRVRDLEEASKPGIKLLAPWSQPCIDAARVLYCGIVNEVERNNYEIFTKRASVPIYRRLAVAGPAWAKAVAARSHG